MSESNSKVSSNSSKSSRGSGKSSSLPGSQQGEIKIHCGDINTTNNDVYPFVDGDGRLYYSTLTGKNGYDVFCWYKGINRPIRLPSPIISRIDDLNYVQVSSKDAFITRTSGNSQSTVIYRLLAF